VLFRSADWRFIAEAAAAALAESPAGVVVLHGTDTMHYTAAALSFMLRDISVPLVLTGSMIPGGDPGSDALANLGDAIRVAAIADLAEVCVVFSADEQRSRGTIIRGSRARKIRSERIDAFASINQPPLGSAEGPSVVISEPTARRRKPRRFRLALELEPNVVLVKLTPVTAPATLARQLEGAAGAVIEGMGVGHIKTDLQTTIAAFANPVVISTQALYEGERLGTYDIDEQMLAIPNIIRGADMTSETALVKLAWALRQKDSVSKTMGSNIVGEIGGELPEAWE
jgi:glutamyl-tRNA(Gln) amidotransferase subunit D